MAETTPPTGAEAASSTPNPNPTPKPASKPLKPPNPMWKYLGFGENFRPRLPSRNWSIFLAITGSFTAAVIYDKREKKRAQRKWCKVVEHIAKEPLDPRAMPRRLTIFLEGPPADGLRIAQDHFKEYVKPILVASGLDWEFIQGRKEGDIRAEVAERIRNSRLPVDQRSEVDEVAELRMKANIKEFDGPRGDIIVGRHTWKEYVRGLHEGWLGPLTEPPKPVSETVPTEEAPKAEEAPLETLPGITIHSSSDDKPKEADPAKSAEEEKKPKTKPAPYILTSSYATAPTPLELPSTFDPSTPISFPHILGFLNTPKRLYRFLHRRVLADSIGREVAAIILAQHRPYNPDSPANTPLSLAEEIARKHPESTQDNTTTSSSSSDFSSSELTASSSTATRPEQSTALVEEESSWHKTAKKRVEGESERTWLDPVVLDERIASRMRRFELAPEEEIRANEIVVPEVEIEGWIKGSLRSLGKEGLKLVGLTGEKGEKKGGWVDGEVEEE